MIRTLIYVRSNGKKLVMYSIVKFNSIKSSSKNPSLAINTNTSLFLHHHTLSSSDKVTPIIHLVSAAVSEDSASVLNRGGGV
ncbi:hypothetical protein AAHA92_03909 [Salvia divinorum]|uniref:Uncharacterized protein n=1 Tax=Salvia divinorum TaxID=28513 RepID=A0ABD1HYS8_SALDI